MCWRSYHDQSAEHLQAVVAIAAHHHPCHRTNLATAGSGLQSICTMEDVNWGQLPHSTPEGTNAQQATQASQAEEPVGTSDNQHAESDPGVPTAWMSDLVQELINTQESGKPRVYTYLSP